MMADNQNQQLNTDPIHDLLSPYLDGEVTDEERVLVEQALAASTELRRELETLRRTIALVATLPPISAPRPFTLIEADVKVAAPRLHGFFDWPIWVRSMAGLATALLCVVVAAGIFLSLQFGGASQPAEIAVAPEFARPTVPETQLAEAPAAAKQEAVQAESVTEEAMAGAAQEQVAAATPTVAATMAALAKPSADEVAEPAAPAGEVPAAEGQAITATRAEQSVSAEQAPVVEAPAPAVEITATPAPSVVAPVEEPSQENAGRGVEADTSQKAAESATVPTKEAAEEAENGQVAAESAPAPAQPPAAGSLELEQSSSPAVPTATLTSQPSATPAAQLTSPTPVTPIATASPTPAPESTAARAINGWFGAGLIVAGALVVAGLMIWLIGRSQKRTP